MSNYSRRHFLKAGLAAAALAGAGSLPLGAARQKATDWVTLGKSGVKVTRLAFGTGTANGKVQRSLGGQEPFTRLVRYAYDNGIRFFETAEAYPEMHKMLGLALQGIPRDTYRLMTKLTTSEGVDPCKRSTSCANSPGPTTLTSLCCTISTRPRGPWIARAGKTAFWKPRRDTW